MGAAKPALVERLLRRGLGAVVSKINLLLHDAGCAKYLRCCVASNANSHGSHPVVN